MIIMSGFFPRPSLRPDTFTAIDNGISSKSGLKAAFQARLNPIHDSNVQSSTSELDRPSTSYENDHSASARGLKSAYQARSFSVEQPASTKGLKQAFAEREEAKNMADNISWSVSDLQENSNYQHIEDDTGSLFPSGGYHSIHRLEQLSNQKGGSNLRRAFEARTGGTVRRNVGDGHENNDMVLQRHADIIVSKMEQDEALMENSPDAEELRRMALRDMPQCLTIKRCVKGKLSKSVSYKSKRRPLTCWKMFKYQTSMGFSKLRMNLKDLAYSCELWYGALKQIEGNFGTGVASFFKFLRWLFLLNAAIALLSICFIVIPKVILISDSQSQTDSGGFSIFDLVTGQGYLTNTPLYYGFYTNETVSSVSSLSYSLPHAYFFTMLCIYLISFAVISVSAARSYRRSFIETEGGLKNVFANKIFCGWDYNIATKDAAELKTKAIFNELKELVWEYTRPKHDKSFCEKFRIVATQFFMNVVVLCLIAGTAAAIWFFLQNVPSSRDTRIIVAPIFINAVMTVLPMLLSFIVRYEEYKDPKVSLYLTLGRTFVLGGVTIGVLVMYWLQNDSVTSCWETSLAQEFYRMIMFDFLISVGCTAILDLFMSAVYKYCLKNAHLEFDIAWNTMQIIYNQTLFWVGLVFSPLLPVVVVVKLLLTWYIRYSTVIYLCKPSAKTWRAAQTSTWFLVMTFLSLLCIGGLVGYIISYTDTSSDCGPFRNYQYIYELVTLGVLQLQTNSTVWTVVLFITKPGVIAIALMFLCAKVYYSRAQANAEKELVEQYRHMLKLSAEDKERVYELLSQATNGQWQYQDQSKSINPELYPPGEVPGSNDVTFTSSIPAMNHEAQPGPSGYSRSKKNI